MELQDDFNLNFLKGIQMTRKTDSLSYERASEILRYDAENGVLERKLKNGAWRVCGHKPFSDGYGRVKIDGKLHRTHRLIWLLTHGEWPVNDIDHVDRNPMNNRIENLRAATRSENQHNHRMHKDNTSGYIGATSNKQSNKYLAQIRINGKLTCLGRYATAEEALTAYMCGKIKYHPTTLIAQEYLRELTLAG